MADVFISYHVSPGTTALVRNIADELESMGVSCWYAPRNVTPGAYPGQIKRAIGDCRVFLLILEQSALHAKYIRSETALAFRRSNNGEPIVLLPFRIDGCDVKEDDDLDFYLAAEQITDGCPPDPGRVQELVEQISRILRPPS